MNTRVLKSAEKEKIARRKKGNHPSATLTVAINSSKTTDQFHNIS